MRSSSVHLWSSDYGLNHLKKVLWMLLNFLNNSWFPDAKDRELTVCDFVPDISQECWTQCHEGKASPSRTLSNLFLMLLPWDQIQSELRRINILDVGCGSGNNGMRLQLWSGRRVSSYVGADLREHSNWNELTESNNRFRFLCADAQDISSYFPGDTNFIISQSTIEHLYRDIDFFNEIRVLIDQCPKPVIQVHLLPSSVGLRLYRWHGVRQYTPRTVSMLSRMFNANSYSHLYRMGGPVCNAVHKRFITSPVFARDQADRYRPRPGSYSETLQAAIATDSVSAANTPSFYALVIHSYAREIIFR